MIDEMVHKNRGHKIKSQKGKVNRRNSIRGTQRFTKPSQTDGKNKLSLYGSFMSFSYDPMYTSGIYNWGNT